MSWIVLLFSVVILVVAVAAGTKTYLWVQDAQVVEGVVVGQIEKTKKKKSGGSGVTYAPQVRYHINGEEREFVSSQSSDPPEFKTGDSVRVAVNLDKGEESIATFGQLYGFAVFGTFLGGGLALGMLIIMNGEKVLRVLHANMR